MTSMKAIKELQAVTGAPLLPCKQALAVENGDQEKATRRLQRQGLAPDMPTTTADLSDESKATLRRGYRFDAWVEALSAIVVEEVECTGGLGRIASILIEMDELSLWPMFLTIQGSAGTVQKEPFGVQFDDFEIPGNKDVACAVVELFAEDQDLDPDIFSFYDDFKVPGVIWSLSLAELEWNVRDKLVRKGGDVTEDANIQVLIHGDSLEGTQMLLGAAQTYLRENFDDAQQLTALAGLCYESDTRREWLVALRDNPRPQYPVPLG